MSQAQQPTYEFDSLPLEPVDAGTNLLVTGPSLGGTRELVMRLLTCQSAEGLLLLTTELGGEEALANYEETGYPYATSRMAIEVVS